MDPITIILILMLLGLWAAAIYLIWFYLIR